MNHGASVRRFPSLLAACLLGVVPLAAQASTDEVEFREPEVEVPPPGRLQTRMLFETEWHEFDNMDFRPLDETTDQAILDSDDRGSFAFTGASAELAYSISDELVFTFAASHRGLWGNDQLGVVNAFGGLVYVTGLHIDWSRGADENPVRLRIGRQYFELGGVGGPDHVMSGVHDMVRFDLPLGGAGRLTAIPVGVLSSTAQDIYFVRYVGQSPTTVFGFRGDHMSRRHGAVLVLDGLVEGLDARLYGFYTRVGALGTGSDISYQGALGNFTDKDWVANAGLRARCATGPVTVWGEVNVSHGIDRKELVARDVDTTGLAYGGGVRLALGDEDSGFRGTLYGWEAWGPAYHEDGLQFSHGYVSMRGRRIGGLIGSRYLGLYGAPHVGRFGMNTSPHDSSRRSGTRMLATRAGYDFPGAFRLDAGWWAFQDTGATWVDLGNLDAIEPPHGYARAEFAAQERLGLFLGQEVNLEAGYGLTPEMELFAVGALFLPGPYYAVEVSRIAGNQLGGEATAWVAMAGTRVRF